MLEETDAWLAVIRDELPAEAKPLAASLRMIARTLDAEDLEYGRVTGAIVSSYRQTHRAILEALRGGGKPEDADDGLFEPGGDR